MLQSVLPQLLRTLPDASFAGHCKEQSAIFSISITMQGGDLRYYLRYTEGSIALFAIVGKEHRCANQYSVTSLVKNWQLKIDEKREVLWFEKEKSLAITIDLQGID